MCESVAVSLQDPQSPIPLPSAWGLGEGFAPSEKNGVAHTQNLPPKQFTAWDAVCASGFILTAARQS